MEEMRKWPPSTSLGPWVKECGKWATAVCSLATTSSSTCLTSVSSWPLLCVGAPLGPGGRGVVVVVVGVLGEVLAVGVLWEALVVVL